MIKSTEQMAKEKIAVYMRKTVFVPEGFTFEVAKRKAKAANWTFASVMDKISEEEMIKFLEAEGCK